MIITNHRQLKYTGLMIGVVLFQTVAAQEKETINTHAVTVGVSSRLISDDYISISSAKARSTDLSYQFSSFNLYRRKKIAVSWNSGSMAEMNYNELAIQYSDAFSVTKSKMNRFNAYLGYAIGTNPQYIKTNKQPGKAYSWTSTTALSLYSFNTYSWNKNLLSVDIYLPLAGFASRPLINTTYNESIDGILYSSYDNVFFTSLHNLKVAVVTFQYSKSLNKNLGSQAGYQYSYKQVKEGYDFLERSHGFHIGLSYQLK